MATEEEGSYNDTEAARRSPKTEERRAKSEEGRSEECVCMSTCPTIVIVIFIVADRIISDAGKCTHIYTCITCHCIGCPCGGGYAYYTLL